MTVDPSRTLGRSRWEFPALNELGELGDLIAVGADLEPATVVGAYRRGYFPMPLSSDQDTLGPADEPQIAWFSPRQRGVFRPGWFHLSRSLRKSQRRYHVSMDTAFGEVIRACGDPARPHGWIDPKIIAAYERLHHLGIAHSVEVWVEQTLVGGLYGISIGSFFAGESMFHRRRDASKVALAALIDLLDDHLGSTGWLFDAQWLTPHLASLGAQEIDRGTYGEWLAEVIDGPQPMWPTASPTA